ncbi:MAG: MaoC family dehydratase [Thermodesulfobacteriota bacterium]|nr:MaoC family dehydratase [Thermodesulfobacteriota bacterium]
MFETAKIENIEVGMNTSYSQTITDADIKTFAGISGDHNPVHMSDEYASESRFGKRIAHGLISASFFSALFGTQLPGPGCVYASQNLQFKRAVYIGDTVVATVTVTSVDVSAKKVVFDTVCTVRGRVVIQGVAEIFIPGKKDKT